MKKRTAAALCALMLAALFSGCTAGNKGNTLRVALSPDYAPMEFVDLTKTGQAQFVGFDVSLANYIADGLGMELEILPMSFDACMTAVSVGSADMAISGFSWMPDREESYNLSDYYYAGRNETEQVLITLASNGGKFPNAESLAGHKVGAQAATLQENLCKASSPEAETIPFATIDTGLMMLEKGDFAAMAVAAGNAEAILANNPQFALAGFRFAVSEKEAEQPHPSAKGQRRADGAG